MYSVLHFIVSIGIIPSRYTATEISCVICSKQAAKTSHIAIFLLAYPTKSQYIIEGIIFPITQVIFRGLSDTVGY